MVARRRRNTQHPHINCASRSFMSRRRRASFLQLYKVARHYWLIRRAGHAMLWRLGGELFADIKIPSGSFRCITRTVSWMQNAFGYWPPKSMYSGRWYSFLLYSISRAFIFLLLQICLISTRDPFFQRPEGKDLPSIIEKYFCPFSGFDSIYIIYDIKSKFDILELSL